MIALIVTALILVGLVLLAIGNWGEENDSGPHGGLGA